MTSSWWACYELNIDVDEALNFVSLTSAFYPELDAYYESVAKIWREDRYRENFEVYSYIGTEIADPGYNNDRPSDDKELIAQISWSWGPASGRTAAYYLCNDRDWTLWERSSDFDSTILLFCQVAWGGSSIDIPARFAAEQLLLATWRKEKELHNTDFHEIEVTQEGLLTNHDIQRISLGVTGG